MAAADGVSVVSSAGDAGSTACLNPTAGSEAPFRSKAVSFPASSPWVTGVGGTNVALTAGNDIARQVVWNNSPALPDAGGGGYSRLFRRPGYQRGFTRSRHRVVPDVSMLADPYPGYLIYCSASPGCVNRANRRPGRRSAAPARARRCWPDRSRWSTPNCERTAIRTSGSPTRCCTRSRARSCVTRCSATSGSAPTTCSLPRAAASAAARPSAGFDAASGLGSVNIGALMLAAAVETDRYARLTVRVAPPAPRAARAGGAGRRALLARVPVRRLHADPDPGASGPDHGREPAARAPPPGTLVDHRSVCRIVRGRRSPKALRHHRRVTASVYAAIVDPTGKIEHHTRGAEVSGSGAEGSRRRGARPARPFLPPGEAKTFPAAEVRRYRRPRGERGALRGGSPRRPCKSFSEVR